MITDMGGGGATCSGNSVIFSHVALERMSELTTVPGKPSVDIAPVSETVERLATLPSTCWCPLGDCEPVAGVRRLLRILHVRRRLAAKSSSVEITCRYCGKFRTFICDNLKSIFQSKNTTEWMMSKVKPWNVSNLVNLDINHWKFSDAV